MEKVYIVYEEGLMHDSSYHGIVEVCANKQLAQTVIEIESLDFRKNIEDSEDFDEIELNEDLYPIDPEDWDEYIVSTKGYYFAWRIEEYTIKK